MNLWKGMLKREKNYSDPSSYQPISLPSLQNFRKIDNVTNGINYRKSLTDLSKRFQKNQKLS